MKIDYQCFNFYQISKKGHLISFDLSLTNGHQLLHLYFASGGNSSIASKVKVVEGTGEDFWPHTFYEL
jgi:hypothetical protein